MKTTLIMQIIQERKNIKCWQFKYSNRSKQPGHLFPFNFFSHYFYHITRVINSFFQQFTISPYVLPKELLKKAHQKFFILFLDNFFLPFRNVFGNLFHFVQQWRIFEGIIREIAILHIYKKQGVIFYLLPWLNSFMRKLHDYSKHPPTIFLWYLDLMLT